MSFKSVYSQLDFENALAEIWGVCEVTSGDVPYLQNEMERLIKEFPIISELDESGPNGYAGIGLGIYGCHVIGEDF